jgi:hypothetical protein
MRLILVALVVGVLALSLRIAYVDATVVDTPVRAYSRNYVIYAQNMLKHGVFSKQYPAENPTPDSYWAPGFPAVVAGAIAAVGEKGAYKLLLDYHAGIGALTAVCTVLIGGLFLPLWGAFLGGVLVALSPHAISMGGYLLTETTFGFLVTVALYVTLSGFVRHLRFATAAGGLLFGVAYMVNPVILFAPFLIAAVVLMCRGRSPSLEASGPRGAVGRRVVYFLIPVVCVAALWSARNFISVPKDAQSASTRALTNFVIGAHPDFFNMYRRNPRDPHNPATIDSKGAGRSWGEFLPTLLHRIEANPWGYARWYILEKPYVLWSWNILVGQGDIYVYPVIKSLYYSSKPAIATYSLMKTLHAPLLMLALLGVPLLGLELYRGRLGLPIAVLYTTLIYVTAVYVIFQAEPRYSVPFRPLLYLCAVYVLAEAVRVGRHSLQESRKVRSQPAKPEPAVPAPVADAVVASFGPSAADGGDSSQACTRGDVA